MNTPEKKNGDTRRGQRGRKRKESENREWGVVEED